MRLTAFILLLSAFISVSAMGVAQKVSINEKDVPLEKVFKIIEKQTDVVFFYDYSLLNQAKKITIRIENASLEDALKICFRDQPLTYKIIDRTVVINKRTAPSNNIVGSSEQSLIDVKGRVINENGEPIEGVSITVKGTNKTVVSNSKGEFSISGIGNNAVIIITGVSVETQELRVNGNADLGMINLKTKVSALNEVNVTINTGYQNISKERSAGAYSKPDMKIVNDRTFTMDILQRLDGLMPGFTVNRAPGSAPYVVRGISSLELNANPLYVVDGVPIEDFSTINPQDIADITLLKDATASSIWGSRAANGVIVVTTKKGSQGDKIQVQYDGFVSLFGKPDLDAMPYVNSHDYIQTLRETFDPAANPYSLLQSYGNSISPNLSAGIQPAYQYLYDNSRGLLSTADMNFKLDSLSKIDNRQQIKDLFYRKSLLTNHTLSVRGGGRVYSFYGSLAYTLNQSPVPTEKNNTYKVNLRQDFRFSKGFQAYLISDITDIRTSAGRPIGADYSFLPYQLFKDAQGNPIQMNYMGMLTEENRIAAQNASKVDLTYTPLKDANTGFTNGENFFSRMTGGVTLNLFKGLRFEGTYGYMYGANNSKSYDDQSSYVVRSELAAFTVVPFGSTTPTYYLPTTGGKYVEANVNRRNWTVRNMLVYDNSFGDKHKITLLAGQEAQDQLTVNTGSQVRGYDLELQTYPLLNLQTLRSGIFNPVVSNYIPGYMSMINLSPFTRSEVEYRFNSYFSNLGYTYKNKYTLNASVRLDKSNLFGLDKSAQNKPVWSAGGKWRIGEENFMSNIGWLSRLDFRATYGLTGNSPLPGSAASYNIFQPGSSPFYPNQRGLELSSPANRALTWERTQTINFGFDFGFIDSRISGSIDAYHKKSYNLLGTMPVNPFTGYATVSGNYGDMINNGLELGINSINIRRGGFEWTTGLNIAYNKNKITKLNNPLALTTGAALVSSNYATGYSAFSIFAYEYAGLNKTGDPTVRLANKEVSSTYAALTPADIKYMGTYQPLWNGGITNSFTYKGFRLSLNAVFSLGNVMRNDVSSFYSYLDYGTDYAGLVGIDNALSGNYYGGYPGYNGGFRSGEIRPIFLNRWKKPGDEAITNVPGYIPNAATSQAQRGISTPYWNLADVNVDKASFIKMRDITLAYSLPESLVRKATLEAVTVRMQVSNILLWKANKLGVDPEFISPTNGARSIPYNQGAISFGLNVNF